MLKDGKITVEEAEKLLSSIGEAKAGHHQHQSADAERSGKRPERDPWNELGEVWERFGSEMEQFWSNFGESLQAHVGQKWAKKMEHWAENFGDSLKSMSQDWGDLAGEAARQFFHSIGVDPDIVINVDDGRVKVEDTWHWEQEYDALNEIDIHNFRGVISLTGVRDESANKVVVDAHKIVRSSTEEKGKKILDSVLIKPEFKDGRLSFVPVQEKSEHGQADQRAVSINFSLTVPDHVRLLINQIKGDIVLEQTRAGASVICQRGDVSLKDMAGPQKVQITKGDLVCSRTHGDIAAQLTRGDISVTDHQGNCALNIIKGDFVATDVTGNIECRSTLGDVVIKGHDGKAKVVTAKGDILLEAAHAEKLELVTNYGDQTVAFAPLDKGQYIFVAHHGDLEMTFETMISAEFEAQLIHGDFASNFVDSPAGRPPYSLKKTFGDGSADIKITVMKGDLAVNVTAHDAAETAHRVDADEGNANPEDDEPELDEDEADDRDEQDDK